MPLKCGSESTDYQYYQLREVDRKLAVLDQAGIETTHPGYQKLYQERGAILGKVGQKVSKDTLLLAWSFGFSPGIIKIWLDTETGWMSEARTRPGAPPVYKSVSDEVAITILKEEVTPELEKELMTPDPYLGE